MAVIYIWPLLLALAGLIVWQLLDQFRRVAASTLAIIRVSASALLVLIFAVTVFWPAYLVQILLYLNYGYLQPAVSAIDDFFNNLSVDLPPPTVTLPPKEPVLAILVAATAAVSLLVYKSVRRHFRLEVLSRIKVS